MEERSVLLTKTLMHPKASRVQMLHIMLETFNNLDADDWAGQRGRGVRVLAPV